MKKFKIEIYSSLKQDRFFRTRDLNRDPGITKLAGRERKISRNFYGTSNCAKVVTFMNCHCNRHHPIFHFKGKPRNQKLMATQFIKLIDSTGKT